jgi:hypothetical protein
MGTTKYLAQESAATVSYTLLLDGGLRITNYSDSYMRRILPQLEKRE